MSTLTITKSNPCVKGISTNHTPHMESISTINDTEFTFCEVCEMNIDRFWIDGDEDRLGRWSNWGISR